MKLLLIDPAVRTPELASERRLRSLWPGEVEVLRPALEVDDLERLKQRPSGDAVVILGSHASVYDDVPWMGPLVRVVDDVLSDRTPRALLGLCFGHQLLAVRAGAVVRPRAEPLRCCIDTSLSSRLLPVAASLRVLALHTWEVADVPRGFQLCATRASCTVDGIEHEHRPIFGFQFHADASEAMACDAGLATCDAAAIADGTRVLEAFLRTAHATVGSINCVA